MRVCPFKPKIHRASAATLAMPIAFPLSFEYIMMLGNGSGTDFQTSPRHHRPALAAVADARCGHSRTCARLKCSHIILETVLDQ